MFTNLPHTLLLLICWAELAQSQSTSVSPGEVPLVVRSPYFNSWLTTRNDDGTAANSPGGTWPTTWGGRTLSWIGSVRVDGTYYEWLGNEVNSTTQFAPTIASYITPTRTVFTVEAGPIQFNTTYLSPVEPSDWVRQSFPFGYLAIDAWSTDGQEHDVSFYSDITGSWLSNDSTDVVQWDTFKTQLTLCHSMTLVAPKPFVENNGMSEDGTMYYAMPKASQLTWQSGSSAVLRQGFKTAGFLNNTEEKNFRAINDDFPTVAISVNLGSISETTSPLVWAIGYVRDPVIRNAKAGSSEMRRSYFWTVYKNINDAIDAFVADFPAALGRAIELDNKLMFEASNVSSQYADLVAMSLRQTFGAMDITVAELPGGGLNSTDVKVYMKDIGSSRRANPVEIIYAAFPALLYLNNTLGRLLLEPLLDLQSSPVNPNPYAAPDLGSTYPDITGNTTDQARLGVENCGSMLIMTLAHARKSGEGSLIQQYAELLKKWADYLVENSLHPDGFITADGLANPDMSNLALKGILGIYAMSIMVQVHQPQTNSTNNSSIPPYQAIAENYARQWESLAFSLDHITSSYGDNSSWGLIYNIYLSQFLKSGLISDQVLNSQASFYSSQVSSASRYGFPYDSSQNSTRSDWLLFTAATVNETGIRDAMISMVHARAFSTVSHKPWPVEYSSNDGSFITGPASAAQGAMFSLLALNLPDVSIDNAGPSGPVDPLTHISIRGNSTRIAGGVVGSILAVASICVGIYLWWRRHRQLPVEATTVPFPLDEENLAGTNSNTSLFGSLSRMTMSPFRSAGSFRSVSRMTMSPFRSMGSSRSVSKGGTNTSPSHTHSPSTTRKVAPSSTASRRSARHGMSSHSRGPPRLPRDRDVALRSEVDELRREMASLRETQQMNIQPPPLYDDLTI